MGILESSILAKVLLAKGINGVEIGGSAKEL